MKHRHVCQEQPLLYNFSSARMYAGNYIVDCIQESSGKTGSDFSIAVPLLTKVTGEGMSFIVKTLVWDFRDLRLE